MNDYGRPITLELKFPLKEKLKVLARTQRRTVENQALCLIDDALSVFESGSVKPVLNERRPPGASVY
jgi:hypothetical protein